MNRLPMIFAILIFVIFFARSDARAQGSLNDMPQKAVTLTAIPPRTDVIRVQPGETFQTAIRLKNTSGGTQNIRTEAQDFIIGEDGKTPIPITEKEAAPLRWSLASWLLVSPSERALGPNETGTYDVLIQVPEDALPGGHYAMVLHSPSGTENREEAAGSVTSVNQRVGTLLYVIVSGDITENAVIRNFTVPSWVEFGPVPMSFTVENLSDIHITPQPSIDMYNIFGTKVDTLTTEQLNIFPYSKRDFSTEFGNIWGFGPYTATLIVPYGEAGKIAMATRTFWMIPYRIILAVLTILLVLLAVIIVIRRHILHRNSVETQHIEVLEERVRELEKKVKQ